MLSILLLSVVGTLCAATAVDSDDTSLSTTSCGVFDCTLNCAVFQKDENGCAICQCDWCEELNCNLECEGGYKMMPTFDGFLCPTCACNSWSVQIDDNSTNSLDDFDFYNDGDEYVDAIYVYLKEKAMLHRLLHVDHTLFKEMVQELQHQLENHMEESGAFKAIMLAKNNGTYYKQFQEAFNDGTLMTNETEYEHLKAFLFKEHYAIDNVRKSKDEALNKLSKKGREFFENVNSKKALNQYAQNAKGEGQDSRRVIADADVEAQEGTNATTGDEYTDALFVYLKNKAILHRLLRMDHQELKELIHRIEDDIQEHMEESGALKAFFLAKNNGTYAKEFQQAYNDGTLTTNETTFEHFRLFIFKEHYAIEEARHIKEKALEDHSLAHGVIDSYVKNLEEARKAARELKDRVIDEDQRDERIAKMKIIRNQQPEM